MPDNIAPIVIAVIVFGSLSYIWYRLIQNLEIDLWLKWKLTGKYPILKEDLEIKKEMQADLKRLGINNEATE